MAGMTDAESDAAKWERRWRELKVALRDDIDSLEEGAKHAAEAGAYASALEGRQREIALREVLYVRMKKLEGA